MSNHSKYEDRFLGERRIKAIAEEGSTRFGSPLLRIHFTDGSSEVWAEKMLAAEGVVTPEASDATQLRTVRLYPLVEAMSRILLDYNVRWDEITFLGQLLQTSLNFNERQATSHLWNVRDLGDRSLHEIDTVLQQLARRPTLDDILQPKG